MPHRHPAEVRRRVVEPIQAGGSPTMQRTSSLDAVGASYPQGHSDSADIPWFESISAGTPCSADHPAAQAGSPAPNSRTAVARPVARSW